MHPKSIAAIVVAAGSGQRAGGDRPKQYQPLAGKPVLAQTLARFLDHPSITHVLPVISPEHEGSFQSLGMAGSTLLPPVSGAATRQGSVLAGLQALAPLRPSLVLIQDAARPLTSARLINRVIEALAQHDGTLPTLPITDTIKRSRDGNAVVATEDRTQLFAAQTPQGFRFDRIFSAHMRAANNPRQFTDDAEIAEWAGLTVAMVPGERDNLKITHPEDFQQAERLMLGESAMETRIGTGFDVHPFAPGDSVWLGGVEIPHSAKLQSHSDADVALHALTDALLGAIGEGDIGVHFPPSDMRWKGAASTVFLKHAGQLLANAGGRIVNLDVTIVCERPRITSHVPAMREVIASTLGIATSGIAIKATTSEQLGFTGREEGIVAMASASVEMPRLD